MACITKRRGRYVVDCYDQNGKRYRKTMKAGTTKDAAKNELREIETKIERRTFIHDKKTPLFSEVKADWLITPAIKHVNLMRHKQPLDD
jgi:hypothetical protein